MKKEPVNTENPKKGLSTNQIIMICGFAILIIVIAVAAFFIYKKLNKPVEIANTGNLVIDENNLADVTSQISDAVADGMFEVNMNVTWHFPSGDVASTDAYVGNADANHYLITFDILLGEEAELIYSSTAIPVGKQIKEIVLDKDLEAGTYDAVCMYHLWKEDGTENSSLGVNITLSVEN